MDCTTGAARRDDDHFSFLIWCAHVRYLTVSYLQASVYANNNHSRDLWNELRKLESASKPVPNTIDGLSNKAEIANNFASKYSELYKSVPTSASDLEALRECISDDMTKCSIYDLTQTVCYADIEKSILKLKRGKSDGSRGTDSDHFICCSRKFKIHLSLLVSCMFVHGYTPSRLLEAVICSIPKDLRGDLCSSNNYRGIALCSALCKLIDLIIIDKYGDKLITSDLQFAFKGEHSTTMCTAVLKEIASYYNSRKSDVYLCMLDASKAFDRVHYGKLFALLRSRKLPAIVIRLLLDMYTSQRMCTSWHGVKSNYFTSENGVKQGGVLSPILFCVYIDELLCRINDSGVGCHIGHMSFAGSGYADDVVIMAPSVRALQELLYISESFAIEYNVLFNASKTMCMKIGNNFREPRVNVTLHGTALVWKDKVKHLGNILTHDLRDAADVTLKTGIFISQVNRLNVKFRKVSSLVKGNLLQTYCCSWYGSQTWDMNSKHVCQLNIQWNKAVRRTLKIPYTTHTRLLPHIVNSFSFKDQHARRVKKFLYTFTSSENMHVLFIGERALRNTIGALGRNRARIEISSNVSKSNSDQITSPTEGVSELTDLLDNARQIRELIDARDGITELSGFTYDEISSIIQDLCCG